MYDLLNRKFGKLTVLERVSKSKNNKGGWLCLCECGNKVIVPANRLLTGHTKSCGCTRNKILCENDKRIYNIWKKMRDRCFLKNSKSYNAYGGRGITICNEWLGRDGFINFKSWAYKNGYDAKLTLDRIDVNGNYEPNNCRWATMREQSVNKRSCHYITYNCETKTLTEWAEQCGIPTTTLYSKLKNGISLKELLNSNNFLKVKIFNDKYELLLNVTSKQMETIKVICKNNKLNISKI